MTSRMKKVMLGALLMYAPLLLVVALALEAPRPPRQSWVVVARDGDQTSVHGPFPSWEQALDFKHRADADDIGLTEVHRLGPDQPKP